MRPELHCCPHTLPAPSSAKIGNCMKHLKEVLRDCNNTALDYGACFLQRTEWHFAPPNELLMSAIVKKIFMTTSRQEFNLRSSGLSDSNTNVNSMINRRVSLFYRYPLKASQHMVCPCTSYGVCVVCPGTSELVGQHPPPISISASEKGDCQP